MVNPQKQSINEFNPRDKQFRRKLWVRLVSSEDSRIYIFWRRIITLLCLLAVATWLGLSTSAWGFVKYKRGITEANFIDIAFYPWRASEYRQVLSDHYLKSAQAHLASGSWAQAVFNLRLSIAKNKHQREARRILAEIYSKIQRTDLSIEILRAGLDEARDDVAYQRQLLSLLSAEKRYHDIIELGDELLPSTVDKNPAHREIVYHVAQAHLALEQFDRGKLILEQWQLDRTTRGHIFLADIDRAQGYPTLAIMQLEELNRAKPQDRIILKLIVLYQDLGRLEDARRIALQRVLLNPNSAGARIDLIALLQATGASSEMEEEFNSFLDRFHDDQRALRMLVNTVIAFPRPDLAIKIRDQVPVDSHGRPPAVYQISVMQAQCAAGEYQTALQTGIALENYPSLSKINQANINLMRAWANYGLGEPLQADTWLKLSLSEDYTSMIADTFLLVNRLRDMGRNEDMRRVLTQLVSHSQGNPLPLTTLARLDIETENWTGLLEYLPQLLISDPLPTPLLQTISRTLPETQSLPRELQAQLDRFY